MRNKRPKGMILHRSFSRRKHVSQMSDEELQYLQNLIQGKDWHASYHVQDRMYERGGKIQDIFEVINTGNIVEYHLKDHRSRVLLRGVKPFLDHVPCVVVEILSSQVITLYWNHKDDHHRTIDMRMYDRYLNIIKTIEEEKKGTYEVQIGTSVLGLG